MHHACAMPPRFRPPQDATANTTLSTALPRGGKKKTGKQPKSVVVGNGMPPPAAGGAAVEWSLLAELVKAGNAAQDEQWKNAYGGAYQTTKEEKAAAARKGAERRGSARASRACMQERTTKA
jgi:hypothetical protein